MAETNPDGTRGLGSRMLYGVSVSLVAYVVTRLLNLVVTVFLAWKLAPEGMGVVAAALIIVELIDSWRDFGLRDALIYEPSRDPSIPVTAFTMMMAIALAQSLALASIAPFAPLVIEDETITFVLLWFALLFPINALGSVQEAMLQKRLQFVRRGLVDVFAAVLKLGVTLAMLEAGFGIWSMVGGILGAAVTRTLVLTIFAGWRPAAPPLRSHARHLFNYGKYIVINNMLSPLRGRVDPLAIAFSMGDAALGLYFIAARIPELIIEGVNSIMTRVIFPSFVTIADDSEALGRAYLATTKWCFILMGPVAVALAATADQTMPLIFGPEWADAAPVLMCLALTGIPTTISWSSGDVFKATGRPRLLTYVTVLEIIVSAPLIWTVALATRDLFAVAATVLLVECFAAWLRLYFMRRFGNVGIIETLRMLAPALGSLCVMAAGILAFAHFGYVTEGFVRLFASLGIGVGLYFLALLVLDRATITEGVALLRRRSS
jgi:lipopolysaccharide exporter